MPHLKLRDGICFRIYKHFLVLKGNLVHAPFYIEHTLSTAIWDSTLYSNILFLQQKKTDPKWDK